MYMKKIIIWNHGADSDDWPGVSQSSLTVLDMRGVEARFVENIHELIFWTQVFWNIKEFKIENHDENIFIIWKHGLRFRQPRTFLHAPKARQACLFFLKFQARQGGGRWASHRVELLTSSSIACARLDCKSFSDLRTDSILFFSSFLAFVALLYHICKLHIFHICCIPRSARCWSSWIYQLWLNSFSRCDAIALQRSSDALFACFCSVASHFLLFPRLDSASFLGELWGWWTGSSFW